MTDKDTITLPRRHIDYAADALEHLIKNYNGSESFEVLVSEIIHHLRTALAAEQPKHPGYVIGSHWLETAYSRVCAGEAEADVLRDCGWERVDEALRRDAESLESLYYPATEILIEGLKKIGTEDAKRVLSAWDSGRKIFDNRFLSRRNTR